MAAVFLISAVDDAVSEALQAIRFQPLTWLMVLASAWWVKDLAIGALGGIADVRRRTPPWAFLWATVAAALASGLAELLKLAVGRARPSLADHAIHAATRVPHSSSFPSGHAATAFAAATVVALLRPAWRWPAVAIAAVVAVSRIYLGLHFLSDVVAGAILGIAVGALVAVAAPKAATWAAARRPGHTTAGAGGS